jgi:hypothetical protein
MANTTPISSIPAHQLAAIYFAFLTAHENGNIWIYTCREKSALATPTNLTSRMIAINTHRLLLPHSTRVVNVTLHNLPRLLLGVRRNDQHAAVGLHADALLERLVQRRATKCESTGLDVRLEFFEMLTINIRVVSKVSVDRWTSLNGRTA